MKDISSNLSESTKEFYYYIGLLSTKFATLENNTMSILGGLITDEIFLINTIIEKNSLSQNIELIKKLNAHKNFEEEKMKLLLERLSSLRKDRNLFIHGLWGDPYIKNDEIMIGCLEAKITPKQTSYGTAWMSAKENEFKLSYLLKRIEDIDIAIKLQEYLLKKM